MLENFSHSCPQLPNGISIIIHSFWSLTVSVFSRSVFLLNKSINELLCWRGKDFSNWWKPLCWLKAPIYYLVSSSSVHSSDVYEWILARKVSFYFLPFNVIFIIFPIYCVICTSVLSFPCVINALRCPKIIKGSGCCREFGSLSSKAMQQAVREDDEVCERLNLLLDILVAHRELCERHEKGVAQDHSKALSKMLSLKKRQMQGVIRGTDVSVTILCTSHWELCTRREWRRITARLSPRCCRSRRGSCKELSGAQM